ncbi:hypothetical protein EVG20_g3186 [Dentipellis fragilis]|uniref:Helicase ATP-binding domain-containing protein n=1 Tax=Dentipellis fragilis TaxID=205917 RepID=A0A4Y9Z5K9_9AGAM|nr:hypothetical protein EVG20_g3186 [Dentipellis fragilis]
MPPFCHEALQTGKCNLEQCFARHDVQLCQLCGRYLQPVQMSAHLIGKQHLKVVAASTKSAAPQPARKPSPTPSDSTAVQTPPNPNSEGIARPTVAYEAGIVDGTGGKDSAKGISEEDDDDDKSEIAEERTPSSKSSLMLALARASLAVSDGGGVDFGEVENVQGGKELKELFPSRARNLSISRKRKFPDMELVDIKILARNTAAKEWPDCFDVKLLQPAPEGCPEEIKYGIQKTIRLEFKPKKEGFYKAAIALTFCVPKRPNLKLVVKRILVGTAQFPRYRPPSSVVPLGRPWMWPSTKRLGVLPFFELPSDLADTLSRGNKEHHEWDMSSITKRMVPRLSSETYVAYFHALLYIEEVAQLYRLQEIIVDDLRLWVDERPFYYNIIISETEERDLPEVGMVGDYILLDDPIYDKSYEGRIHARVERYNPVTKFNEAIFDVRLPEEFSMQYGSIYKLRFKLNRIPLRRMHHALDEQCHLSRLLFPTGNDVPILPRIKVEWAQLISKLYNKAISGDSKQLQAVLEVLQRPRGNVPFIIFGPPGTGKTTTVIECILQLLLHNPSARILVCTPSNSAADLLTYRLANHLDKASLFRFSAFSRSPFDIAEMHLDAVLKHSVQNEHNFFSIPPTDELAKFRVVVSTCCNAGALRGAGIARGHFGWIFVDEATQASEPEAMVPIRCMAGEQTDVVLAGDPKQLRPVVMSAWASGSGLQISYLERLMKISGLYTLEESGGNSVGMRQINVVQLQQNRRSHAKIIAFSNSIFYEDKLRACAEPAVVNSLLGSAQLPNKKFPVTFHGIIAKEDQKELSKSYSNAEEAQMVERYCLGLIRDHDKPIAPKEIGVISPYKAQVRHIKAVLRKAKLESITVGSVEQFQGQERRVIILSTTRSNKFKNKKAYGFLNDPHRLNVALTRAQAMLVVIGNPVVLGQDSHWKKFLNYVRSHGASKGTPYNWKPHEHVSLPEFDKRRREQPRSNDRGSLRWMRDETSDLQEEKIQLENVLEAESESHVNRLSRELTVLRIAQQQQAQQEAAQPGQQNGNGVNGHGPVEITRTSSMVAISDPLTPSTEIMLEAMRRENEQLRNRLVNTEREYIRITRLNEIYREELIDHRRRLGLSVDNLIGLSSSLEHYPQPTHRRSASSSIPSPVVSPNIGLPLPAQGQMARPGPSHSVPIPRHRPFSNLSESNTPISHSPSSSESPFLSSPMTSTNPASLISNQTQMTTPPSSALLALASLQTVPGHPQLSYPSVPPPSLSSSFGSPNIHREVSTSPMEPHASRWNGVRRGSFDRRPIPDVAERQPQPLTAGERRAGRTHRGDWPALPPQPDEQHRFRRDLPRRRGTGEGKGVAPIRQSKLER